MHTGQLQSAARLTNKILSAWTVESLADRIQVGERLLQEFRQEPPWMADILRADLARKRSWLDVLRADRALR